MSEENKALVKKVHGLISEGNVDAIMEMMADDVVDHAMPPGMPGDKAGIRAAMEMWFGAFNNLKIEQVQILAEGNLVAAHVRTTGTHTGELMGIAATNKSFDITGTEILRIEDGKLKERWANEDMGAMFMQLGVEPPKMPG